MQKKDKFANVNNWIFEYVTQQKKYIIGLFRSTVLRVMSPTRSRAQQACVLCATMMTLLQILMFIHMSINQSIQYQQKKTHHWVSFDLTFIGLAFDPMRSMRFSDDTYIKFKCL